MFAIKFHFVRIATGINGGRRVGASNAVRLPVVLAVRLGILCNSYP